MHTATMILEGREESRVQNQLFELFTSFLYLIPGVLFWLIQKGYIAINLKNADA